MSYSNNGHVHNPASCTVEPCQRCDDYGTGYAHGKAGAHVELLPWEIDDHAASCGCPSCRRFGGILIRLRRESDHHPPRVG